MTHLITGHEEEMAYNREFEASAEFRALRIQGIGEMLVRHGETLERAAKGALVDEIDIFGEPYPVAEQVAVAQSEIASAKDQLIRILKEA